MHNDIRKFRKLKSYLKAQKDEQITLSFSRVEQILQRRLLKISKSEGAGETLWSNESDTSSIWIMSGYRIQSFDHEAEQIVFVKDDELMNERKAQRSEAIKEIYEVVGSWLTGRLVALVIGGLIFYGLYTMITPLYDRTTQEGIQRQIDCPSC
jgi:hypothetical protein